MPFNANNVFYQDPINLAGANITPLIVSADISLPTTPFNMEAAETLLAVLNTHEFLVTAFAGAQNDLAFIARTAGATPTIRVTLTDPAGNNVALSVVVATEDVNVTLATDGTSTITTTAAQLMALLNADAAVNAIMITALAPANDGTGIVTALVQTALGGPTGTTPTLDVTLKHGLDATNLITNAAFAQKTTATSEFKPFTGLGSKGQWLLDVGGTTPVFAVSIVAQYRP